MIKRAQKYIAIDGCHKGHIVTAVHKLFCSGCGLCPECYGRIHKFELYELGQIIRIMIQYEELEQDFIPLDDYYEQEDLFAICLQYGVSPIRKPWQKC